MFHLTWHFLFQSLCICKSNEFLRDLSVFLKAADGLLRVRGRRQNTQVPRGRQTLSAQPLEHPPICDDLGGADAAVTADGERQETVREDLGVRDAAGLAVGERFSLMNRPEAAATKHMRDVGRPCQFPVSQQHKVCSRCRTESDKRLRDLSHMSDSLLT